MTNLNNEGRFYDRQDSVEVNPTENNLSETINPIVSTERFNHQEDRVLDDEIFQTVANGPENSLLDLSGLNALSADNRPNLGNLITAMPTLYHRDGAINLTAMREMMAYQASSGVDTVLIAGTTGEASSMTLSEHIRYVEAAVNEARNFNLTVVAGSGSNSTSEAVELTEGIRRAGADASLVTAPYYIKTNNQGLIEHFWATMNIMPTIIYSIAGRTGMTIPIDVIRELRAHPNFLGVKECDGSDRVQHLSDLGIRVWTGNDDSSITDVRESGASGSISVISNIIPELSLEIVSPETVMTEVRSTLTQYLSNLSFPAGIPNPMMIHNIMEATRRAYNLSAPRSAFRSPVIPLNDYERQWMVQALNQIGIDAVNNCSRDLVYYNSGIDPDSFHTPRY